MANYVNALRTNYFRVKDENAFKEFMSRVEETEGEICIFEDIIDGEKLFAFGCYGLIAGINPTLDEFNDEDYDPDACSYDEFVDGLQKLVADDDAIVIYEAGNEKMRYVNGTVEIITSTNYKALSIIDIANKAAAKLLGNPSWTTRSTY